MYIVSMNSCPNIGGSQIKYRKTSGYISLCLTLLSLILIMNYNIGIWKILIFLPSIVMSVSLLEAYSKTCIVYSTLGIKHMGTKYERERYAYFLKSQRKKAFQIVFNGLIISAALTGAVYYFV